MPRTRLKKTHPFTKRLLEFRLQPIPIEAGTRHIFELAEANARGILFVNFSRFTVYAMEEASSSASKSLYRFRVDPYTVFSSPIDMEYINILVDTAPDGTTPTALPNEFIHVGLFEHKFSAITYNVLSQRVTIANTPLDVNILGQPISVEFPAPQAVDVTDEAGRLLGIVSSLIAQPGAVNYAFGQVSIGAGASGTVIAAARATRRAILIENHGAVDVFLGDATVTVANGLKLKGIDGAVATLDITGAIRGIVAAGSQTVSFFEIFD